MAAVPDDFKPLYPNPATLSAADLRTYLRGALDEAAEDRAPDLDGLTSLGFRSRGADAAAITGAMMSSLGDAPSPRALLAVAYFLIGYWHARSEVDPALAETTLKGLTLGDSIVRDALVVALSFVTPRAVTPDFAERVKAAFAEIAADSKRPPLQPFARQGLEDVLNG